MIPIYECKGNPNLIRYPCYAELKYDGEYNVFQDGKLINKYGKERDNIEATNELSEVNAVFLGELFCNNGTRGSLYELLKDKKSTKLKYAIFDIIAWKGESVRHLTYLERKEIIYEIIVPSPHIDLIMESQVSNKEGLQGAFDVALALGFEGIVVKNGNSTLQSTSTGWVKMKGKETADLLVVKIDDTQERIEVRVNDSKTCGVKVCNRYKKDLKVGDIVEIEYQGILSGNGLRHPVYLRKRNDKEKADTL